MAVAAAAPAILTGACRDGAEAPATTTPAPPASPTAEPATPAPTPAATADPNQQLLEKMVLEAEDLPTGLQRASAITSTNEDVAAGAQDPEQELARLESLGRLLGYEVDFIPATLPERGIAAVSSAARLFLAADGAAADFAEDVEELRAADWAAAYPDLTDFQVRELDRPDLADQVIWMRVSGLEQGGDGPMRIEDFVVLQRNRVWSLLRVESRDEASAGPDAFIDDIAALVALQVQRIDSALLEG